MNRMDEMIDAGREAYEQGYRDGFVDAHVRETGEWPDDDGASLLRELDSTSLADGWQNYLDAFTAALTASGIDSLMAERELAALCANVEADAVGGLRYIERHYGRLEGVGWDRVFDAHDDLFARALLQPSDNTEEQPMNDDQIKHMTERFLRWRLPENFSPDAGISFEPSFNVGTPHEMKHEPTGTNLFDATQAEAMVRHMIEGLPDNTRGRG